MSERINKLILETEFKTTGDISPSVQKIDALTKAAKAATGNTLQLVEAEKKLEQAAAQAGVAVETETKKQTEFSKAVQGTSKAMKEITTTNVLAESFKKVSISAENAARFVADFKKAVEGATKLSQIDKIANDFKKAAIALDQAGVNDVITQIGDAARDAQDELVKFSQNKFVNTTAIEEANKKVITLSQELRKLRDQAAKETDPVLLQKLNTEAAKLENKIKNTNELISALASDTFFADTLVQGAQTAAAAFSTLQGAVTLFSEDNEELAKAAQKAQGALSLLVGIQQLNLEFKKADNIVTRTQILLQKGYALSVGQSVGAMKALRLVGVASGIGILVIGLIALIENFDKVKNVLGFGVNPETERYIELSRKAVEAAENETKAFEVQASALRAVADRKQEINDDSEQAQLDRANAEINIINRETEFLKANLAEREKLIEQEENKLNELVALREKNATGSFRGPNLSAALGPSKKDIEEQKKILSDLENLQGQELVKTIENGNKILQQEKSKTEALKKNLDKQNDDRLKSLAEQERHALAVAGIEKKSEGEILAIRIDFAQRRLALTQKIGKEDAVGIQRLKNEIEELKLELASLRPEEIEVFTPGSLNALNKQAQDLRKVIDSLPEGPELLEKAEALRVVQDEIQRLGDIISGTQSPEEKRTSLLELLDEDERYQLQSLGIAEETEQKKLALQIKFQKERIAFLIAAGEEVSDIELMRAQNDLKLLEQQYAKGNEIIKKSNRELVLFLVDGFSQVISAAADAAKTIVSIEQDKYAQLTELQQKRVSDAEKIADRGNAVVLEAEQKRLDELNKKNEEFAQKQIAIAQIQLVAESALAIAKAAAQGGAGAAFTIAAVLIAMAAGFAQARAQSQAVAASFREGGYTGDGDPSRESKNLGDKPYTYHKGEYVIPAPVLSIGHNKDWFTKIHNERIDLDKLLGIKQPSVVVNSPAQERGSDVFLQMNLNSAGIISIKEKHEKLQKKREFLKNWKRVK